jgi:hypothetical protein
MWAARYGKLRNFTLEVLAQHLLCFLRAATTYFTSSDRFVEWSGFVSREDDKKERTMTILHYPSDYG